MDFLDNKRRNFLKLVFAGFVTAVTEPTKLLGVLIPKEVYGKQDKLQGIYGISLDDYPQLVPVWGSIRIKIENTLMFYPKVVIVHVPKENYDVDFIAVSERCPHEGYPIKDLDPDLHLFECSGHGTLFDVTGKYVWGPASRDLERIPLEYDGDKTIYLDIPLYPLNKLDEDKNFAFLFQNKPNPCSNETVVEFGTEKSANVRLILFDSKGKLVEEVFSGIVNQTTNSLSLDVTKLQSGTYFLRMYVDGIHFSTKKLIVEH
jgi:Rieske Fe-S protein